MKVSDYIYQSRILLNDITQPQAWSDEELALYTEEAYRETARLTRCIRDTATPTGSRGLCTISIVANVAEYSLNPKILDIYSVKHSARIQPLSKTSIAELDMYWRQWWTLTKEIPDYYLLDQKTNKILFVPTPTVDGTIKMSVSRLPLVSLLPYNPGTRDEELVDIREEWQPFLLYYILYKAFSKDDIATRDTQKAAENYKMFLVKMDEIKRDMARYYQADRPFAVHRGCL